MNLRKAEDSLQHLKQCLTQCKLFHVGSFERNDILDGWEDTLMDHMSAVIDKLNNLIHCRKQEQRECERERERKSARERE